MPCAPTRLSSDLALVSCWVGPAQDPPVQGREGPREGPPAGMPSGEGRETLSVWNLPEAQESSGRENDRRQSKDRHVNPGATIFRECSQQLFVNSGFIPEGSSQRTEMERAAQGDTFVGERALAVCGWGLQEAARLQEGEACFVCSHLVCPLGIAFSRPALSCIFSGQVRAVYCSVPRFPICEMGPGVHI